MTRRNLQADKHSAEVTTLRAVVEQGDVPVSAHGGEKTSCRSGSFGKPETEQAFTAGIHGATANHVTNMGLRQLIICQVDIHKAMRVQLLAKELTLLIAVNSNTDKDISGLPPGKPVIELGNVSFAYDLAAEAAHRRLSTRHLCPCASCN